MDIEKEMSDVFFQVKDPSGLRPDEDVVIVCPSYSRVEADLDLAFQGIEDRANTRRQAIVLYIHNVTEHALSRLNTQLTVDADLKDKYGRVTVIDLGVTSNRLYQCPHNKESIRKAQMLIKQKDSKSDAETESRYNRCLPSGCIPFSYSRVAEPPVSMAKPMTGSTARSENDKNGLLAKPWRPITWTEATIKDIKTKIKQMDIPSTIPSATVLVLGHKGAGKTSLRHFIQDIFDADLDDSSSEYWVAKHNLNRFQVVGAEDVSNDQVLSWLQGPSSPTEMQSSAASNGLNEIGRVSCVVLLANAKHIWHDLDEQTEECLEKICTQDIPRVLMLTHVDYVCPDVKKDMQNIYRSEWLKTVAAKAAEVYYLPISNVHIVKSYSRKEPQAIERDILILRVLKMAFEFSCDFIDNTVKPRKKTKPTLVCL